jgi:opacity protein-like surface antigen
MTMLKSFYFQLSLVTLCFLSSYVCAVDDKQGSTYLKIKAGIVQPTAINGNTGLGPGEATYTAGAVVGRRFNELLSFDVEYMFRAGSTAQYDNPGTAGDPTSWKAKSNTYMLNMNIDLILNSRITPYLRFGIGMSQNDPSTYVFVQDSNQNNNDNYPGKTTKNFAWQVGSGVNFFSNEKYSVDLEYMYVDRGSIETEGYTITGNNEQVVALPIKGNLNDHVFTLGFKFNF